MKCMMDARRSCWFKISLAKSSFPELCGAESSVVRHCEIVEEMVYCAGNLAAMEFKCHFLSCTVVFYGCNPGHNICSNFTSQI